MGMLGLFGLLGIGVNLAKDAYEHNKKPDPKWDTPANRANKQAVDEIIERQRREYEKRTGKKAYW